jgi:hypothetical protein
MTGRSFSGSRFKFERSRKLPITRARAGKEFDQQIRDRETKRALAP